MALKILMVGSASTVPPLVTWALGPVGYGVSGILVTIFLYFIPVLRPWHQQAARLLPEDETVRSPDVRLPSP